MWREAEPVDPLHADDRVGNQIADNEVIVCVVIARWGEGAANMPPTISRKPDAARMSGLMFQSPAMIHGPFKFLMAMAAVSNIILLASLRPTVSMR